MASTATPAPGIHNTEIIRGESIRESLSWPAIFAGNAVTGGFILVLMPLGLAAGLSMVSPFSEQSASGSRVGTLAIFWLAFMYLFSVSAGGYVAGRLRPRAGNADHDEVRFRDGMNGFVFWGVGMIISALFTFLTVSSAVGTLTRAAGQAAGGLASGAGSAAASAMPAGASGISTDYLADLFLRPGANQQPNQPQAQNPPARGADEVRSEIGRIMARSVASGQVDEADKTYLIQLVAQQTGLSENDARQRVDETIKRATDLRNQAIEQTKVAAEQARKASARAAFWTALASLLTGIAAWYAAQLGGRHRDENLY